ncbi:MAG: DUF2061 domain-containing protein [Steroidobacteraceae bacterium]|jgi:uncharacterized membrane protein|nr:DUF2061 domain-containing protein [Steroidobacteraceae bacterium]
MNRDLLKTLSFAALHFGVAFTVAYALTGSVAVATGIGLVEQLANTVAFYLHERLWRRAEADRSGSRRDRQREVHAVAT